MIPNNNDNLQQDFEIERQPSKTYYLDIATNRITGYCDNLEAMKQAIYKILNTERFEYLIYSWNYGIELKNLIGERTSYVIPELERVIEEALLQDDRISEVKDFNFEKDKTNIIVTFTVVTTEGDVDVEKVVSYVSG